MNNNNYVAIMAGGIGSRFWPLSRTDYPKQFLDILNTGKTLLQATFDRFAAFIPAENIFIVTAVQYQAIVQRQVPQALTQNILAEPARKNTAPCIAYISYKIHQQNPNANLICAPSDHLILNETSFINTCLKALEFTENIPALVTLGIQPTHPNTGYGYIQHEVLPAANSIFKVKTFTEKPDKALATAFVDSGDFLWNAGIFIWSTATIIKAFETLLPEIHDTFDAEKQHFNTELEGEAVNRIYHQCVNVSIDVAIMEKAKNVYTIPSNFGWSDLGTWASAYDNLEKDYFENAVVGNDVMVIDATKNVVFSQQNKLVVLQGLNDYVIVDTADVLLICKKDKEQELKNYVAEIKSSKGDKFL
jgi:mannose-1-phosphate guanylyltransferase